GLPDPRLEGEVELCTLAGSDEFLRGFSTRAIPQHTPDTGGCGRGDGLADQPSQAGQPQPMPNGLPRFPAIVAGREIPGTDYLGSSSNAARRRAMEDETERLVQLITDKLVEMVASS
ncbi:MAG: hypothetical protein WBF17_12865, partial [Phycisphaerae bacterium]